MRSKSWWLVFSVLTSIRHSVIYIFPSLVDLAGRNPFSGELAKNEFSERNMPAAKSTTTELTAPNMQCFSTGIFSSRINYLTWESIVSVSLLTHPTCIRSPSEFELIIAENNTVERNNHIRHNNTFR